MKAFPRPRQPGKDVSGHRWLSPFLKPTSRAVCAWRSGGVPTFSDRMSTIQPWERGSSCRAIRGKKASAFGNIDLPHTYTFINDFGKALVTLGEQEESLGRAWHVPNGETLTTREFVRIVYEPAGTECRVSVMGRSMLRMGGVFIPPAREMVEMMYEFEKPFIVDSSRYVQAFGNHATPVREAIRNTVEWYKTAGGK